MLDLTKNYCYDKFLINDLSNLKNLKFWEIPDKNYVYNFLSNKLSIDTSNIEIGFGTIDILDRLLSLFNNKTITTIGPHWKGLEWCCEKNNLKFDHKYGDIAYIAYPNGRDGILRDFNFNDYQFVIVDEAYSDFCDKTYLYDNNDNLIITKTFSKSLSSPGIRFAYAKANEEIIKKIRKKSHPYSMCTLSQQILPYAFDLIDSHIERMLETKSYLQEKLNCLESHSNFVRCIDKPPYDIKISRINNYYRFTLVDIMTLKKYET